MATRKLELCIDGKEHVWRWYPPATDLPRYKRRWCIKCRKKYADCEVQR